MPFDVYNPVCNRVKRQRQLCTFPGLEIDILLRTILFLLSLFFFFAFYSLPHTRNMIIERSNGIFVEIFCNGIAIV